MQVLSIHRYAKISPFKAREVTREIQGLPALDALAQLKFIPKKAAPLVYKVLKSAIANAEQNNNIRPEILVIKEAVIGEAPTMKRIRPTAKGSAVPIRKRTSHIRILLTDELPIKRRSDRSPAAKKSSIKDKTKRASLKEVAPQTPSATEVASGAEA